MMGMGHRVGQVWYSKHKHRGKKQRGWFVMRNEYLPVVGLERIRVASDLTTRDEAIAMVKLFSSLEESNV